jgi:hydrogenase expression/formation protein HypE
VSLTPIGLAAGDGLGASSALIRDVVRPILKLHSKLEDGARVDLAGASMVVTTDLYSVDPLHFPGGDIGLLAACGAINDLAASGARIRHCTLGIYASAQLPVSTLEHCLESFAQLVLAEGAVVICGDTKVHNDAKPELILCVTAMGAPITDSSFDLDATMPGDDIVITGPLGDHSIAVLSAREGLGFDSVVSSDAKPMIEPVAELAEAGLVHSLRDLTRGGLVAALWDAYRATGLDWTVNADAIPVRDRTQAAAEMIGLDPLALTNEGCMLVTAPRAHRERVLDIMASHSSTKEAVVIGTVMDASAPGPMIIRSDASRTLLSLPSGLGIPRLC